MKKILVIGPGGAGKSTFAKALGEQLSIDVFHLDALYWRSGWIESEPSEWEARLGKIMRRDSWILDGNYSGSWPANSIDPERPQTCRPPVPDPLNQNGAALV